MNVIALMLCYNTLFQAVGLCHSTAEHFFGTNSTNLMVLGILKVLHLMTRRRLRCIMKVVGTSPVVGPSHTI